MDKKQKFSQYAKAELLSNLTDSNCCKVAWLAAAIKAVGSLHIEKKGVSLIFESENLEYIQSIIKCIKQVYFATVEATIPKGKKSNKKSRFFTVKVPYGHSSSILKDSQILLEDENGLLSYKSGIANEVVKNECCAKSYLKSLFVATGSANVPIKIIGEDDDISSSGREYYLEFLLIDELLAEDLVLLLKNFNIVAKITERKGKFIVYIKESDAISNFFALLNANETVLYMQDIIVERLLNNNLNRKSNCEVANYDKIAIASTKQIIAINKINKTIGFNKLPEKLQNLAKLRLENPTATLDFFVNKLNGEVSKSGINHRFRKIISIADDLPDKKEED